MAPKKILKESRKRLRKKGHTLNDDDKKKIEQQIQELKTALANKSRSQAKKTAGNLKKKISQTMPKSTLEVLLEYAVSFAAAILIALVIRHFLIEPFKIPTGSMIPTFKPGDYILVNKARYGPRIPFTNVRPFGSYKPRRWDIVVFTTKGIERASRYPKNFVKRIVGLPGEEIEIRDGEIYVNEKHIEKPEYMKGKIIPYGVIQKDIRGWYNLKDPPNQDNFRPKMKYYPISGKAKIDDGEIYVDDHKVIVAKQLQGDNLPLSIGDDGMTVYLNGVYYNNTPEGAECRLETWNYRINLFDFHFWRIPGTQGVKPMGPHAVGYRDLKFTVSEGHYLLLGDNSGRSYDSRGWGFVPYKNIKGRVLLKWWPPTRWGIPH